MQRIGGYEVVGHLASGGQAEVLLGRHPNGQTVVLKRALSRDPMTAARLRDEARLGMRLGWGTFARTLELLEHEGEPVVALEWIDGVPLEALWKVERLSPWAVAKLGSEIASALALLHELTDGRGGPLNAVHRDLSSRNILVEMGGRARVIDLGAACSDDEARSARTEAGNVLGTVRYLAPEVFETSAAAQPADLWSLGVVLLECALGRALFKGTPSDVAAAVYFRDPFAAPDAQMLPESLGIVLRTLLQRTPLARPSAARAAEDLAVLADELAFDGAPEQLQRHAERARVAVAAGLVKVGTSRPSDEDIALAAAPTQDIDDPEPTLIDDTVRGERRGVAPEAPTVPYGARRVSLDRGEFRPAPMLPPPVSLAAPTVEVRALAPMRPLPSTAAPATTVIRAVQQASRDTAATVEVRAVGEASTDKMHPRPMLPCEVDTPVRSMRRGPQGVFDEVKLPSDASVAGVFRTPVKATLEIEVVVVEEQEEAGIHRRVPGGLEPMYRVHVVDPAMPNTTRPSSPLLPDDSAQAEPTQLVRRREQVAVGFADSPSGRLATTLCVFAFVLILLMLVAR